MVMATVARSGSSVECVRLMPKLFMSYDRPFRKRNCFPAGSGNIFTSVLPVMRHQAAKSVGTAGSYAVISSVWPSARLRMANITSMTSWPQPFSPRSRIESAWLDVSIGKWLIRSTEQFIGLVREANTTGRVALKLPRRQWGVKCWCASIPGFLKSRKAHLSLIFAKPCLYGQGASKRPGFVLEWHVARQSYPEQAARAKVKMWLDAARNRFPPPNSGSLV